MRKNETNSKESVLTSPSSYDTANDVKMSFGESPPRDRGTPPQEGQRGKLKTTICTRFQFKKQQLKYTQVACIYN